MRNPTLQPKKPTPSQLAREALRQEVKANAEKMTHTPARGSAGRAGKRDK